MLLQDSALTVKAAEGLLKHLRTIYISYIFIYKLPERDDDGLIEESAHALTSPCSSQ